MRPSTDGTICFDDRAEVRKLTRGSKPAGVSAVELPAWRFAIHPFRRHWSLACCNGRRGGYLGRPRLLWQLHGHSAVSRHVSWLATDVADDLLALAILALLAF